MAPQIARVCPNLPFAFNRKETGEASAVRSQVFSSHGLPTSLARRARDGAGGLVPAQGRPAHAQDCAQQRRVFWFDVAQRHAGFEAPPLEGPPDFPIRQRDGAGPQVWSSATTCSTRSRGIQGSHPNRSRFASDTSMLTIRQEALRAVRLGVIQAESILSKR